MIVDEKEVLSATQGVVRIIRTLDANKLAATVDDGGTSIMQTSIFVTQNVTVMRAASPT